MGSSWKQPKELSLAKKLNELNERLKAVLPLLIEAQAQALIRMAETVKLAQPEQNGTNEEPHD